MEKFNFTADIVKVDKERRIVTGFATLDNMDNHGDIITADATRKAFNNWRRNVRLMHQPIPAGKVVDFSEQEIFDDEQEKLYRGMLVDAYISKGAEDVWEMVLDGTLTGFSIGGKIVDKHEAVDDDGNLIRYINDYELVELSLVDNPANPLANILSIQKNDDGLTQIEGMVTDIKAQNVMYCDDCTTVILTEREGMDCNQHGDMTNIGWVEDTADKAEAVKSIVNDYKNSEKSSQKSIEIGDTSEDSIVLKSDGWTLTIAKAEFNDNEGGVELMAKEEETVEKAEEVEETEEVEKAEVEEEEEEVVAKAAEVSEFPEADVDEIVEKLSEKLAPVIKSVKEESEASVAEAKDSFEEALDALKSEFSDKLDEISKSVEGLEGRVSDVEDGTAVKKSADAGADDEDDDDEDESVWRGVFLGANDLVKA